MTTLIVGCGYLGRRVAARLIGRGEKVSGTTRHIGKAIELIRLGIEPVVWDVMASEAEDPPPLRNDPAPATPHPIPPPQGGRGPEKPSPLEGEVRVGGSRLTRAPIGLPESDRMVYCVGFDRRSGRSMREVYVEGLRRFLDRLDGRSSRFVYTSSTSVYGQEDGSWVSEDDPTEPKTESGRVVLDAEEIARSRGAIVVRLAGLYGPGRIIRRDALLAGEAIAADPEKRVNLVHVDDAASAIVAALDRGEPGRVYNVADDRPVGRRELYEISTRCLGVPPPRFVGAGPHSEGDRRVANRRMKEELRVTLAYPDVTIGLPASVAEEGLNPPSPR